MNRLKRAFPGEDRCGIAYSRCKVTVDQADTDHVYILRLDPPVPIGPGACMWHALAAKKGTLEEFFGCYYSESLGHLRGVLC
jgi:hypothetical protein